MNVYFSNRRLQKICSRSKDAQAKYGPECAKKLQQRLMELRAATCLADMSSLPNARCHPLKNRKGQFSVDLKHPLRLLFIPSNNPLPTNEGGGLDRSKVTEIEVVEIADTH